MGHCFFVKQNVQIPFQFKACHFGALWVLVVRRKFLMRMYEAQTYIISFVIFLCPHFCGGNIICCFAKRPT